VTITEALKTLHAAQPLGDPFEVQLACGFTPLHLKTLLAAHLQRRLPARRVVVNEGTFGDLVGTIERTKNASAIAIALEWQDLDPRLGFREGSAWGNTLQADLGNTAKEMPGRIESAIFQLPQQTTVALSLPTLPIGPLFHPPTWQAGQAEIALERDLIDFAARIATRRQLRLVNRNWLNETSPLSGRFDLKSDLLIGFPYTISHTDQLAAALALQLVPRQPLKGVITDLDDTLWSGLAGEIGPDAVRWDPASRYYLHGLYQKLLSALADEGVLVAIATKNDPQVVAEVLKRQDLLVRPDRIFPVEVHWSPKSESVTRILKKWNISAESVAFVDDTALELAEVSSAHPGITTLLFPTGDYQGVLTLLKTLRDLCGKSQLSEEDAFRMDSIRQGVQFQEQVANQGSSDEFLSTVRAIVAFDFDASPAQPRTLELVNKTNQFNLNGVRFAEAEWQNRMNRPGSFLTTVKYEDKFGALGTIAVLQGYQESDSLRIATWVMSCRAFSRRIEHQILKKLFERYQRASLEFDFVPTAKNSPLQEFFAGILGEKPETPFRLCQSHFESVRPALYHQVVETSGVTVDG